MATGSTINTLNDVGDVNASSPGDGQLLSYNTSTSKWVPTNAQSASTFSCPSGFTLIQNQGQTLGCIQSNHNSSATCNDAISACWSNYGARLPLYTEVYIAHAESIVPTGATLWTGSAQYSHSDRRCGSFRSTAEPTSGIHTTSAHYRCFIPATGQISMTTIAALSDVSTTGATTNDILAFDGTNWVVSQTTVATGSTINEVNDIGDVTITSASTGDLLSWNGTAWVNQTVTDTVSTTTISAGWPDAIRCVASSGDTVHLFRSWDNASNGDKTYRYPETSYHQITFNSSQVYSSHVATILNTTSCQRSISQFYTDGDAFNFIGNNGASTNLAEIGDVSATSPSDAQILAYSSTNSRWEPAETVSTTSVSTNYVKLNTSTNVDGDACSFGQHGALFYNSSTKEFLICSED